MGLLLAHVRKPRRTSKALSPYLSRWFRFRCRRSCFVGRPILLGSSCCNLPRLSFFFRWLATLKPAWRLCLLEILNKLDCLRREQGKRCVLPPLEQLFQLIRGIRWTRRNLPFFLVQNALRQTLLEASVRGCGEFFKLYRRKLRKSLGFF